MPLVIDTEKEFDLEDLKHDIDTTRQTDRWAEAPQKISPGSCVHLLTRRKCRKGYTKCRKCRKGHDMSQGVASCRKLSQGLPLHKACSPHGMYLILCMRSAGKPAT